MFNALVPKEDQSEMEKFPENSFRKLYVQCSKYCMHALSRYTKNLQEAEDVFSEAMATYWLRSKQGKIKNNENIPSYVFTIAKHLLFSRRKKWFNTEDLESHNSNSFVVPEPPQGSEINENVKMAFANLSESCQELLILKYVYKFSYSEMAEKLNRKSSDSLKTQTFRCLKRLKEILEKA